ncbi:MAG TPA: hypothetical protein DCM28_13410 [Phycisphaerales bacterium]|nr:hypothetical protein [Phycisphaerales bacterium]HCD32769.1 hypothetical protein [Phycisphaerales bacterium]|tara:strand:+ start:87182 stop:89977 length:2796 start_codon:yes stop_codon:yes gene_type:complete
MPNDSGESNSPQKQGMSPAAQLDISDFEMIMDMLPVRIMLKDLHNNILWVNRQVCETLKQPIENIRGRNLSDFCSKETCDLSLQLDQEVLAQGKPVIGKIVNVALPDVPDKVWLQTNRIPIKDESGTYTSILSVAIDVTEMRNAQIQLEQTTHKFESFMKHSPVMQWAQDKEARYLMVNQAYEKLMRLPAEQIVGKLPGEVHHAHADEDFIRLTIQSTLNTLSKNEPIQQEVKIPLHGNTYDLFVTKFVFENDKDEKAVGGIAIDITDLKKTQAQLLEIQQRYELAVNGTTDGLWDWDLGDYCWYSQRYRNQLGYEDEATFPNLLSATVDRIHPDDVDGVWEAVNTHLQGGSEIYDHEFRLQSKDGTYRWYRSRAKATVDETGKPVRMTGSMQDVQDRVIAQQQLEQTKRKFESFMEHSPVLQWAQDKEARYIMVNEAFEKLMKVPASKLVGHRPREIFIHPGDQEFADLATECTLQTFENNEPLQEELTIQIHGQSYDLLVTKFVFDQDENEQAVGGIAVDISDLKKVQAQLQEIQQRYELAVNGTTDGLWDWDLGEYCWYSERYRNQLGYDDEESFPNTVKSTNDRIHPEDVDKLWGAVAAHLERGEVYDCEFRLLRKDGTYNWFRSRAKATFDETGKPIRMTGALQDVQDRIMAQQELANLNSQLEDRVKKRTAQLAKARDELEERVKERTAQLAQSNELLSIRNHELDQFAHIAAHDLRSPLRTIAGFGDYLKELLIEWDNPEAIEYINRLLGAAFRMEGLIDSLLTFSRVGRSEMNFSKTDLNVLLEDVKANLAKEIQESDARITADTLPTVSCDSTLIGLVFQNLISNSIRYCVDKAPEIKIKYTPSDKVHKLCFSDNGIGFEDKNTAQIFEPFQRLHGPARKTTTGHGVGLSICKRVIERHNGGICAESEPGKGANFHITLPNS